MRISHIAAALLGSALLLNASVTLDELITMALKNSPDIDVSRLDFNASTQRVIKAKSYYLPSIDLNFDAGYGGEDYKNTDMLENNVLKGSISASQLIYDFGKTGGGIDGAISDTNASKSTLQQVISNKIFDVKNAYYRLLQNRSLLVVHKENVDLNQKQLYRSKRYYDAGIKTKIDVTDAKVNLIKSKINLQDNLYDIKLSRVALEKIIGIVSSNGFGEVYQEELDFNNILSSLPKVQMSMSDAEKFAFQHRYELKSYFYQVKTAKSKLRTFNADYYPAISAKADYAAQNVADTQLFVPEQYYQATLNAKWNIFSGFKTNAQTQEAKIAILRAQAMLESAKLKIKEEVDNAFILIFKSLDALKLSQSLSEAAKEKHIQAQQRYEHGLSDYIELQQSRQNYIDSLASLVTSYYDYYRSLAGLDRAIGR
jgi:outer membrane protein